MRIVHAAGVEGAREAAGLVVVIDVLRAFTVAAVALARGARESLLVATLEEARRLAALVPGSVLSAEEGGLPVPGVAVSNSPAAIEALPMAGRTLIQRTSAGTQGVVAAGDREVLAAALVVASATAREISRRAPETLTLVAMGEPSGHVEDRACALYLEGLLTGRPADLEGLLSPLRASDRYRRVESGLWPGFPPRDLEIGLQVDAFSFAMPVTPEGGFHRLRRLPA